MMMEEATHVLEWSQAIHQGHRDVVTKLVHEAEDILHGETLDSEQHNR